VSSTRAQLRCCPSRSSFNWAVKWELIDLDKMNPMKLVRVEGSSKRLRQSRTLTVKEFRLLLERLEEPIRTMCIVATCLGLRASEVAGLQWGDFDWGNRQIHIQRGFVIGHVDEVKTTNSNRSLPVHRALATLLLEYKKETAPDAKDSDWLFPSPYGTGRPRWPWTIQRTHLLPAGIRAGLGWLAHVSAFLLDPAARLASGFEGSAGASPSRGHPHDNEHLHASDA
jgi:integrase